MSEDEKLYVDLWVKQSDLFLKLVALVPVVELAIVASWYTLMKDGNSTPAQWVAALGALVMAAATIILWRTTQYIGHFRSQISRLLPASQHGITGRSVGLFLPALCVAINMFLATGCVTIIKSIKNIQ